MSEALLQALETARDRLLDDEGQPVLPGWDRCILYYFSDLDQYWTMQVAGGVPEPAVQAEPDEADIRITTTSKTFIGLMEGSVNPMMAVAGGKVRVKASIADMRQMQVFM
ncbi:MAG: SCP2 sterol-binding domain-containing protein [Chloroflexia bacterium]|nr:SCP2 sterol-binding domain-containing protein [Chloroflexia bacterium]